MPTPTKQAKPKNEPKPERKPPATSALKDLDADAEKADKVRGGPMRCVSRGGC